MQDQQASRRAFVGGAIASVATIAAVGSLLREGDRPGPPAGGITIVPGETPVAAVTPATAPAEWQALVGRPAAIVVDTAALPSRIREVRRVATKGRRPAGVRQEPFEVIFEVDAASAPRMDRIYPLAQPIAGLTELFLSRGMDVAGKTTLTALFN